jgi:hypothetical protein
MQIKKWGYWRTLGILHYFLGKQKVISDSI